jgi:hypothetical protein
VLGRPTAERVVQAGLPFAVVQLHRDSPNSGYHSSVVVDVSVASDLLVLIGRRETAVELVGDVR